MKNNLLVVIVVIIFLTTLNFVLSTSTLDNPIISLPDGQVQGAIYTTLNNISYYGFRGIPYATPPIGDLRFETPLPAQSWDGILDATNDSKSCISIDYFTASDPESEDCLYINVYTTSLSQSSRLPVMFWIFGGGFLMGNSSKLFYGPDFLVEENVIVVSFNYRLGPFGFLSTADTVIPGNAGLKDQSLALKWTYDNIAYFGGDPEKITIFGQSAGGISAGLHLLSKKSTGLFRAAILESGSPLMPLTISSDPRSYAFLLANAIHGGDYGNDTNELKKFLLERTAGEIMTAATSLPVILGTQLWPNIEVDTKDSFLTESPYELIESGRFAQVPIMTGICGEESLMFFKKVNTVKLMALLLDGIPGSLIPSDLRANSSDKADVIKDIQSIYLTETKVFLSDLVGVAKYVSDNTFTRGIIKHSDLHSKYAPVYLYQFAYYGRPITPEFLEGAEKAGHASELPFLFNIPKYRDNLSESLLTQRRMTKLWTNFAKYLNPTPEKSELLNNITWPTISPTNRQYLNINGTLELLSNIRGQSYFKWNEIYETYGSKPFITF